MRTREIKVAHRLDKFIIEEYGEYTEYLKSAICFFNPFVDFLRLSVGTKLLVPTRAEISSLGRIRGHYDLVRD